MSLSRLIANLLWLPLMAGAAYLIHQQAGMGWGASVGLGVLAGSVATFVCMLLLSLILDR
jgi:hypothetical protein